MVHTVETTKFDTHSAVSLLSTYVERARQDMAVCMCVRRGVGRWTVGGGKGSSNYNRFFQVRVTII